MVTGRNPRTQPQPLHVLIAVERIVAEGLSALFRDAVDVNVVGTVERLDQLAATVEEFEPDIVLMQAELDGQPASPAIQEIVAGPSQPRAIVLTHGCDSSETLEMLDAGASGAFGRGTGFKELLAGTRAVASGDVAMDAKTAQALLNSRAEGSSGSPRSNRPRNGLTHREQQVLVLIGSGLGNNDVAKRLHISVRTVETHRANLKRKLGARNTADLVRHAMQASRNTAPLTPAVSKPEAERAKALRNS